MTYSKNLFSAIKEPQINTDKLSVFICGLIYKTLILQDIYCVLQLFLSHQKKLVIATLINIKSPYFMNIFRRFVN